MGVLIASFFVIADSLLTPPQEKWDNVLQAQAGSYQGGAGALPDDPAERVQVKRAAEAQWQLAERYLQQGDLDAAEAAYRRLKSDFPYELDYGYRADDATKRIAQIAEMRRQREERGYYNAPLPIDGDL